MLFADANKRQISKVIVFSYNLLMNLLSYKQYSSTIITKSSVNFLWQISSVQVLVSIVCKFQQFYRGVQNIQTLCSSKYSNTLVQDKQIHPYKL